jgi:hypothetical protein
MSMLSKLKLVVLSELGEAEVVGASTEAYDPRVLAVRTFVWKETRS